MLIIKLYLHFFFCQEHNNIAFSRFTRGVTQVLPLPFCFGFTVCIGTITYRANNHYILSTLPPLFQKIGVKSLSKTVEFRFKYISSSESALDVSGKFPRWFVQLKKCITSSIFRSTKIPNISLFLIGHQWHTSPLLCSFLKQLV